MWRSLLTDLVVDHLVERGQHTALHLGLRRPQLGAHQGFGAVQIGFAHLNFQHQFGQLALGSKAAGEFGLIAQAHNAVHAQAFIDTRHEKKQADTRIQQQVVERIEAVVATGVGQQQMPGIGTFDKTGRAATWRCIKQSTRRTAGGHDT